MLCAGPDLDTLAPFDTPHINIHIHVLGGPSAETVYSWQTHHCLADPCVTMETQHQVGNSVLRLFLVHTQQPRQHVDQLPSVIITSAIKTKMYQFIQPLRVIKKLMM